MDWYYYPVILDNGHIRGSNLQSHLPQGVNEFLRKFFEMVIDDCVDDVEYDSDNYHRLDFVLDLPKAAAISSGEMSYSLIERTIEEITGLRCLLCRAWACF